jgi:FMN phosphatase YigB (HAD superfamily)
VTVIFDFGWTLAEYAGGGWSAWAETVGGALTGLQDDLASAAKSGQATEYERAVLTEIEEARAGGEPIEIDGLWASISRDQGPYSANAKSGAIEKFGTALTSDWRLYPETVPVLDILSRRRVAMGLVSDVAGPAVHWASLAERLGLNHYIRAMAFSEELCAIKPDPRGILTVLNDLKTDPEDAIYVGDTPGKDVDSAVAAGVKAIWLKRRPEARLGRHQPAHTVDSLRDIISIV